MTNGSTDDYPSDAYPGTVTLIWADCWEDAALEEPCEVLP